MRSKIAAMLAGSSLLALASPALAQPAQDSPSAAAEEAGDDEIVVTGTFIRGIAPTGNQVLGVTAEDIQASGAMSTKDVLAEVPQLSNFFNEINSVGTTGNASSGTVNQSSNIQVQRPALRNLSTITAGTFPTLVLMDGHRLVGAGVNQSSPDSGLIPPGAIERVEIVTDGGTALYGTDAVGGVINFITRRSYDGVQASGRYSLGDEYSAYDANLLAGTDWGSGSIYGAISYNESDALFGRDRDWYKAINWNPDAPFGQYLQGSERRCAEPNVTANGANYPVIGAGFGPANTFNFCDLLDDQTIAPEQTSESFFGGLTQELTENIELNVRAQFAHRESINYTGGHLGQVNISPGNPNYRAIPGDPLATQTVRFTYEPYNGTQDTSNTVDLETWSITPALQIDLPADWQVNLLSNYGESETFWRIYNTDSGRELAYLASGALNPYDVASSDPAALEDILNAQRYGFAHQTLTNYRAVFDGPLLTLPGGQVRAAFGAEYIKEEIERREGQTNRGAENTLPLRGIERDVNAVFGELNIPIVGAGNRLPLVESLTLALSARYDNYSDFGETTNPQIGLVWEPAEWLSVRATWGESFNAPSPIEVLLQNFPLVSVNPGVVFSYPGAVSQPGDMRLDGTPIPPGTPVPSPAGSMSTLIAIQGASPDLQPQTGESWSLGFDATAPFLPDLRISATWYKIEFRDTLFTFSTFVFRQQAETYERFSEYLRINGLHGSNNGFFTDADIAAFCGQATNSNVCAGAIANPDSIYSLTDSRFDNGGGARQEGLDFSIRYSHDFDWGMMTFGASGNYRINAESQNVSTGLWTESDLDNGSRYAVSGNVGATVGDFYGRATVRYSAGYNTNFNGGVIPPLPTSTGPFQSTVDPFVVTDLFFRYDLGEVGLADNLQLTLNVDNVFDEDPPILRTSNTTSAANGTTLGRIFTVGLTADF